MQALIKPPKDSRVPHGTELEFDIYSCEHEHLLIVERKRNWNYFVKYEVGCPFCRAIADYRTTVKVPELEQAIQRYVSERKKP